MRKKYSASFPMIVLVLLLGCSLQEDPSNISEFSENVSLNNYFVESENSNVSSSKIKEKNKQFVAFNSTFKIWCDTIPSGTNIEITVYGSGTATHLGNTEIVIEEEIKVEQVQNIWTSSATVVASASNGDELHISFDCTVDLSQTPDYSFTATGKITGGTGRFENAEGILDVKKRLNWNTLDGTATFTGLLSY